MKRLLRRLFPSVRRRTSRPGRPTGSGYWRDADEFERALLAAVKALEEEGRRPTQEAVSRHLNCNVRSLSRWHNQYGISWTEITRRSLSNKP